jgi:DNA mismatch endonuclease (patch repair protein)
MEAILRKTLRGGKFSAVSSSRRRTMAAIRQRGTRSTEWKLRMALVRSGVKDWVLHPLDLPARPDLFFPRHRIAIFVDGCFWHGCRRCGHIPKTNRLFWSLKLAQNKRRDRRDKIRLRKYEIVVIRIWEHDLVPGKQTNVVQRIQQSLQASCRRQRSKSTKRKTHSRV